MDAAALARCGSVATSWLGAGSRWLIMACVEGVTLSDLVRDKAAVVQSTSGGATVPQAERLWVFPFAIDPEAHWQVSHAGWLTAGLLAIVVIAAALTDAPWWHVRRNFPQQR